MEEINKIIANNLIILRKNAKFTQMEVAEKFKYSDKTVSKWENGESLPSIDVLYDIAKFYNTTLDELTNPDLKISKNKVQKPKDKMFPTHLIITLLATSAVWWLATVLFVVLQITKQQYYPILFLWAVPASCVVLIVFNSLWGRSQVLFPILSVMLWTLLASIHVQCLPYSIWQIYFLGIPLQIGILLWSALIKKPHVKKNKNKTAEQTQTSTDTNN